MNDGVPAKWRWTNADFDRMSWHDNTLHAIAFDDERAELELDIDYIFRWLPAGDRNFEFLVAPATLIFHSVLDLQMAFWDAGPGFSILALERDSHAQRDEPDPLESGPPPWVPGAFRWSLDLASGPRGGEITFIANGFTQYVRQRPRRGRDQRLSRAERGGISFARRVALP